MILGTYYNERNYDYESKLELGVPRNTYVSPARALDGKRVMYGRKKCDVRTDRQTTEKWSLSVTSALSTAGDTKTHL